MHLVMLLCEGLQRRAFLKKNAARLGPDGATRAAAWPFDGGWALPRFGQLAVCHLAGLCFIWQALLAFVV
jgi:hypothetical protein